MGWKVRDEDMYGFVAEGLTFSAEELTLLIPEYREKVNNREVSEKVKQIDQEVIANINNLPDYWEDDDTQPLEKWWWHLKKIKEGTYPVQLLPEYLRKVYLKNTS